MTAIDARKTPAQIEERVEECCQIAKQLEKAGRYEEAYEALISFWPDRNQAPQVDAFDVLTQAEIFMRAGALAGHFGGTGQAGGTQEFAKNLITRSVELFDQTDNTKRAAEARGELALCYWREGAFDEARIQLQAALRNLGDEETDLKAVLLIRAGIVEAGSHRLQDALRFYNEAAPVVEKSKDHALKGSFHNGYGLLFRQLAAPENREDYLDKALIEYTAASFHFEQAGNERFLARVENNLGYLYFTIGRHDEAHRHLDQARFLFVQLRDVGMAATVDDTRAQAFLAEGRLNEAERLVKQAIRTLESGDEQAALAEALITYGVVLARLGRYGRSRELLERAMETAHRAGDLEGAGRARLSMIEELTSQITPSELATSYESAFQLLEKSQDPATAKRLVQSAVKVIAALTEAKPTEPELPETSWEGFSFKREVLKIEKIIIERALRDSGGAVTKASRLLGFRHHQSLIALINSRHKDLLGTRSAIRKRRQHLFSTPRRPKKKSTNLMTTAQAPVSKDDAGDTSLVER